MHCFSESLFLLLLQQKKAPQGFYINLIFRNAAGELAPMRFRRLPGVTGPCPSTTLDKLINYIGILPFAMENIISYNLYIASTNFFS